MSEALDLKSALEQDRQQVLDLLETTRRLVLEVRAAHYWTVEALNSFTTLLGIGQNIQRMLAVVGPHWSEGKDVFKRPEAIKLYKTAIGLWAALRPVRQKFGEQLDKRRRQRIMGEDYVEAAEVTAEEIEKHVEAFSQRHAEMWTLYVELAEAVAAIPAGLVPLLDVPKMAGAAPGAAIPASTAEDSSTPAASAASSAPPAPSAPAAQATAVATPAPASDTPAETAGPQAGMAGAPGKLTLLPEPGSVARPPQVILGTTPPMGALESELPQAGGPEDERLQPQAQAEQFIASLAGAVEEAPAEEAEELPEAQSPVVWPEAQGQPVPTAGEARAQLQQQPHPAQDQPLALAQDGPQNTAQDSAPALAQDAPTEPVAAMPQDPPAPVLPGMAQGFLDPMASLDRLFGAEARQHDGARDADGQPRITWGNDRG